MNGFPIISLLTFTPLVGAILLWLIGKRVDDRAIIKLGFGFTGITFLLSAVLGLNFDPGNGDFQLVERYTWIPTLNLDYSVGVDGLSLLMIWLTTLLIPISLLTAPSLRTNRHQYTALVLLLETGLIGTFTAMNFFHWFLYWEICLIPAFFLIRLWGGPGRTAAAVQFFIYTFVGSVGLLLSFLALFAAAGTFEFSLLAEQAQSGELMTNIATNLGWVNVPIKWIGMILFVLAFLGVAVKVPLFPFHTWLPSTYAEAPSSVTILLTGLMSKMGVYALLRLIVPIFGAQMQLAATPLLVLAVMTILFSAFAAYRQDDLKRVFAYSSINHLGYCFLGVFAVMSIETFDTSWQIESGAAINGVVLQMFNHGIVAGLIFFLIGRLESRTEGLRGINDFGGLRTAAPLFSTIFGIALFASLGLPGLNAFIGEFLIFKGAFGLVKWAPAIATIGLLITAVFILSVIQKVITGPINEKWKGLPDLNKQEKWVLIPGLLIMLLAGVFPQLLIRFINESTLRFITQIGGTP